MPLADLWTWIEELPISGEIGASWGFPLCESIHVITSTFVLGSILMVDLRLLGLAARHHPVSRIVREVIPWTITAFVISAISGGCMFMTQSSRYMNNRAFQVKLVLLALAVVNMAIFHRWTARGIGRWDTAAVTVPAARVAGGCSLLLWVAVMLAGRWVGHLL
jgi:hypothetical protein